MSPAPFELNQNTWRHLFEVGEGLISCCNLFEQADYLKQELNRLTNAQIEIWLLRRFEPLPSKSVSNHDGAELPVYFNDEIAVNVESEDQNRACVFFEVPLAIKSTTLGKIRFTFNKEVFLTLQHRDFLRNAGRYIAAILDTARLSAIKDWRHDQLSLVRNVSFEITRYRSTTELFRKIVDLVQTTFHFYFVAIYTFEESRKTLSVQANAGKQLAADQLSELNMGNGIPLGEGLIGICAESGHEILSTDVQRDPRYRAVAGLEGARSELCLPLISNDKALGVLQIIHDYPYAFHDNDIMVLKILADSIAVAIENADLFDDLFEKTWASTVMLQVAEAAQAYDNVDDLLDAIVRILPLLVGVDKCAIFMQGKYASEFFLNAHYGFEKELEPKLAMLPYEQKAAERFHQVAVLKIPLDLDWPIDVESNGTPHDCCKLVPLVAHDLLFGIMMVDQSAGKFEAAGGTAANRKDVIMAIGRQIALAIENFRLENHGNTRLTLPQFCCKFAQMVAASENLDETLANVINLLPLLVGIDTALVYLQDEQSRRVHLRSAYSKSWKSEVGELPQTIKNGFSRSLDLIAMNQKPVFCQIGGNSPAQWLLLDYRPFLHNNRIPKTPDPSLVIFPLHIGNENFGFLMVYETNEGVELREKKIEIIRGVAQQLSIAIQNERLKHEMVDRERIRREFQLAQEIQKTFLPEKMPQFPGWEISVRWRPALQVGGDFYDVIPIGENQLGLVIADVSDKGLPAALTMTVARTLIHAAAQAGNQPAETLKQVNRLLLENSREGFFVTVFYALLSIDTGQLVYTNAGHTLPLLLRKNHREMHWLEKDGMPLGITGELKLENKKIHIKPGDHLVMYTDGVTEARSPEDTLFGEDRLFNTLHTFPARSEDSLIEVLDSRILEFQSNAPAADDVTIFVIQRLISEATNAQLF
jgi:serine phosphatase RsbU (regulator of sigma subunit)/putative methionine-R-sulfoxide reductase with GAF domain